MGVDRVAAPDHDQIAVRADFRGRHAPAAAMPGLEAGVREHDADRALEPRVFLDVGQALDAVALHQPHRAGIEIGPHRLGTVALLDPQQILGDLVQRIVPADAREFAGALRTGAAERKGQAVRMMEALMVAGHLGADHPGREGVARRAPDLAEPTVRQLLHLQRANRRAVMGADRRVEGHRQIRQGSMDEGSAMVTPMVAPGEPCGRRLAQPWCAARR